MNRFFENRRIKRNWRDHEIDPEDIFLDSANISSFDEDKFEGRLEKPLGMASMYSLVILFSLVGIIFAGRLYFIQVAEGEEYKSWSEENRLRKEPVFAHRGTISDRNGEVLVWNEEGDSPESTTKRRYKEASGLAHVLGYVSVPKKDSSGNYYQDKFIGQSGAEEAFDDRLSGENGIRLVEENARLEEESRSTVVPAVHGENISLSIDYRLNQALFDEIKKMSAEIGFSGGAGIMMDVETGEIIAMTSFPEYSPQVMTDGEDNEAISRFLTDPANHFLNRAVGGLYTPGSTMKPYVAVEALEENKIDPYKEILSTGQLVVPNPFFPDQPTIFRDWKAHGLVNMREALAHSSNVYFFHIGGGFESQPGIGIAGIEKIMKLFGFGEPTGIELSGEASGTIPNPSWKREVFDAPWVLGDTYNTSIGQFGFQVTPLQLTRSVSAIANRGRLVTPTLLKGGGGSFEEIPVSDRSLQVVREGMRQGAEYGTGKALNVSYTDFAVKTGTAELGTTKADVNSWTSGYFPYKSPKYSFVIVMEKGDRDITVGATAVARRFFDWVSINAPEYYEN